MQRIVLISIKKSMGSRLFYEAKLKNLINLRKMEFQRILNVTIAVKLFVYIPIIFAF